VIDNLIAEGDRVVAFWTLEDTHAGMLFRDAGHRAFLHRSRRQHASDRRRTITEYEVQAGVHSLRQQLRSESARAE
jgi:hypothetical protein